MREYEWRDGTSPCVRWTLYIRTYTNLYLHWSNVILFVIQHFSSTYNYMSIYTVASVLKSPHTLTVIFTVDLLLIIRSHNVTYNYITLCVHTNVCIYIRAHVLTMTVHT